MYFLRLEAPLKTQYQLLIMTRILLFCVAEAKPVSQFAVDRDIVKDFALYWQQRNTDFGYQFIPKALREFNTKEDTPPIILCTG